MAERIVIPDEIQSAGGEAVVEWLIRNGQLTADQLTGLNTQFGVRAKAAVSVEGAPELTPELEILLFASFEENMAMWRALGVFTSERQERGYREPTFEDYKASFARHQAFARPGRPNELGKGYDTVNFVPMDVPLASADPKAQTMVSLLGRTIREEFERAGDDKPANSLVIKTRGGERTILIGDQVRLADILWTWEEEYLRHMVHRPTTLSKKDHGGVSGTDLLAQGTALEQQNGGFMRLERSSLMLPQDIGQRIMSAVDWKDEIGRFIPKKGFELQTAHDGIAFLIQFIRKHHCIPDAWTKDDAASQVALFPETYFPDEDTSGAVAAVAFHVGSGRLGRSSRPADFRGFYHGVRGGVRINEN